VRRGPGASGLRHSSAAVRLQAKARYDLKSAWASARDIQIHVLTARLRRVRLNRWAVQAGCGTIGVAPLFDAQGLSPGYRGPSAQADRAAYDGQRSYPAGGMTRTQLQRAPSATPPTKAAQTKPRRDQRPSARSVAQWRILGTPANRNLIHA